MKNIIDMSKTKGQQLAAHLAKNRHEKFVDDLSALTQKFTLFDLAPRGAGSLYRLGAFCPGR